MPVPRGCISTIGPSMVLRWLPRSREGSFALSVVRDIKSRRPGWNTSPIVPTTLIARVLSIVGLWAVLPLIIHSPVWGTWIFICPTYTDGRSNRCEAWVIVLTSVHLWWTTWWMIDSDWLNEWWPGVQWAVEQVTMDMVVWMGQVTSVVKSQYCMVVGYQAGTEWVTGLVSQGLVACLICSALTAAAFIYVFMYLYMANVFHLQFHVPFLINHCVVAWLNQGLCITWGTCTYCLSTNK